jgi:hypothetical protein
MTNCPSCAFAYEPTSSPPRCPACGAVAQAPGGFAPPPMGGVPGQGPYAPGPVGKGYGPPGHPGGGYGGGYGMPQPRDLDVGWLLWGAIGMVFCCQPMGIAAIILMDQAKTAYRLGDDAKAQSKMGTMKTCIYVGIGLAAAVALLYVGIFVVIGVTAATSRP